MKRGNILILTGPPATGKNTVGELIAGRLENGGLIDVDAVRWMIRSPHKAPWEGEEGVRQRKIGVQNACALSRNLADHGFDTVLLDVLTDWTTDLYRELLAGHSLKIIKLMPSFDVIWKRNNDRGMFLTRERIESLYREQQEYRGMDAVIDNSGLSAEETADAVLAIWQR